MPSGKILIPTQKSVAVIADELEEEEAVVERICEAAEPFAPDYDEQEICKALMK